MSSEVIDVKSNLIRWNGKKYRLIFEKTISGTKDIVLTLKEYDRAVKRGARIMLEDLKFLKRRISPEVIAYLNHLEKKSGKSFKREYDDNVLQVCYEAGYFAIMNEQLFNSSDKVNAWTKGNIIKLKEGKRK